MTGNLGSWPCVSLMSAIQPLCESSGSIESPMHLTWRLSNSPVRRAT